MDVIIKLLLKKKQNKIKNVKAHFITSLYIANYRSCVHIRNYASDFICVYYNVKYIMRINLHTPRHRKLNQKGTVVKSSRSSEFTVRINRHFIYDEIQPDPRDMFFFCFNWSWMMRNDRKKFSCWQFMCHVQNIFCIMFKTNMAKNDFVCLTCMNKIFAVCSI